MDQVTYYEKTLVARIKSNLLLNIQIMSSLQIIQLKTDY
jgi:hypothetical protein